MSFTDMANVIRPPRGIAGQRTKASCPMSLEPSATGVELLVIVSVDVTTHRFVLIRSGMRTPGASLCPPPTTDPQYAENDRQSGPFKSASYHDDSISTVLFITGKLPQCSEPLHCSAFLNLAQRAFCAAAILARPAALIPRRFLGLASKSAGLKLVALPLRDALAGRPGLRLTWVRLDVLVKSAFACCSRKISASIVRRMSFVFMNPPSRA